MALNQRMKTNQQQLKLYQLILHQIALQNNVIYIAFKRYYVSNVHDN